MTLRITQQYTHNIIRSHARGLESAIYTLNNYHPNRYTYAYVHMNVRVADWYCLVVDPLREGPSPVWIDRTCQEAGSFFQFIFMCQSRKTKST